MDISYLLDYEKIPKDRQQKLHILVSLETWPEEKGKERQPLNLALVLDRSGSMEGKKLCSTKEAASLLVQKLHPKDFISIVAYDSQVEVLMGPTPGSQKFDILRKIDSIEAKGCTNLSGGWIRGLSLVLERASSRYINRVLLMTDGLANEGVTDLQGLQDIGRQFSEKQISTTTLGFGDDFNEEHLMKIATSSGGRFFYISGPEGAPSVFMSEFGDLIKVVGQNLKVQIATNPALPRPIFCGQIGHTYRENALVVELGDLLEEDRRQVLATLELPPNILSEGKHEIGHIQVTYDSVRGIVGPRAHAMEIELEILPLGENRGSINETVEREIVYDKLGETKLSAARLEEGGDHLGAAKVLEKMGEYLESKGYLDSQGFKKERDELFSLAKDLLSQKINRSSFRKTMKSSSYSQTIQIGTFKKRPNVFVDRFVITPSTEERMYDILEKVRSVLSSFGHNSEFIDKSEFILRELVDNGLEHGCTNKSDGVVEGELRISKHYFKCIITDHGPGFDFVSIMAQQKNREPLRAKGLLAMEKLGALLHFNREGNSISATLSSQGFVIHKEAQPFFRNGLVGEIGVIKLQGSIDNMTHYRVIEEINQAIQGGNYHLILDMTQVRYVSSSGIGALVQGAELCREREGRFLLAGTKDNIRNILNMLGLLDFFELVATVEEGLQHLS